MHQPSQMTMVKGVSLQLNLSLLLAPHSMKTMDFMCTTLKPCSQSAESQLFDRASCLVN
jgi:hypothetical protein